MRLKDECRPQRREHADGDIPAAIGMHRKSLEYLSGNSIDHTEIQTRYVLLQAQEFEQGDLEQATANPRDLTSRYLDQMPDNQREMTVQFVDRLSERYAAERGVDAQTWRREQFPALFG